MPGGDKDLVWQAPRGESIHIEIVVRDRADRRLILALDIALTVGDRNGKEIGAHKMPLV